MRARAPVLALRARPGDLASEGTVVQVVSLVEEREGGLDFLRGIAGAGHLGGKLTLAVAPSRQTLEGESQRSLS